MMPMGGAGATGNSNNQERGASPWQVRGDLLSPEEQAELDRPGVIDVESTDKWRR